MHLPAAVTQHSVIGLPGFLIMCRQMLSEIEGQLGWRLGENKTSNKTTFKFYISYS